MTRKKIVVMGFMAGCPIAGVVWQHLHYIVGLQRLGHDVYYIEDSARYPYNPVTFEQNEDYSYAARTLANLAAEFGFEGRWSYCARFLPGDPCAGLPKAEIVQLYRDADAILNVCGSQEFNDDLLASERILYVESDPGVEQIKVDQGNAATMDYLGKHHALFTFGESVGSADFPVPRHNVQWLPTRQPVVTDFWKSERARGTRGVHLDRELEHEWPQGHRMARRQISLEQVARVFEIRGSAEARSAKSSSWRPRSRIPRPSSSSRAMAGGSQALTR